MRKFIWLHVAGILVLLLFMISCDKETTPVGAVPVTPEMLESVSRSLAEQTVSEEPPSLQSYTQESTSPISADELGISENLSEEPAVVYWTESGTVYHLRDTCSTLKRSVQIFQGSVEDALLAQKERACKTCS